MILHAYSRYRVWAARFGAGAVAAIGGATGLVGAGLLAAFGTEWVLWNFLPWFAAVGGPIAALDAYGAAAHRGAPREGAARATAILLMLWGFAGYAFFWPR